MSLGSRHSGLREMGGSVLGSLAMAASASPRNVRRRLETSVLMREGSVITQAPENQAIERMCVPFRCGCSARARSDSGTAFGSIRCGNVGKNARRRARVGDEQCQELGYLIGSMAAKRLSAEVVRSSASWHQTSTAVLCARLPSRQPGLTVPMRVGKFVSALAIVSRQCEKQREIKRA